MPVKSLISPEIKSGGGDFQQVEPGVYLARCYRMIDLGTQAVEFEGEVTDKRQIELTWELLQDEAGQPVLLEGTDKPLVINKTYTWSMHERAGLRKDINAWRGKDLTDEEANRFEISKLLGQFCTLQVVEKTSAKGKTYAKINSIMATKRTAEGVNEIVTFSVDDVDLEVFSNLSEYTQNKINGSQEFNVKPIETEVKPDKPSEDGLPF